MMKNLRIDSLIRAGNFATIVLGVALSVYIVFLLMSNYFSLVHLRRNALEQLKQETEKRSTAVKYFFAERKNDLRNLATSRVLSIYFENKALGMSMEYGLRASLLDISEQFRHVVEERTIDDDRIYTRIIFVTRSGELLADNSLPGSHQDFKRTWKSFLAHEQQSDAVIIAKGSDIVISIPYVFKNEYRGQIVAWIAPQSAYDHLIRSDRSPNQFTGLCSDNDNFYLPEEFPMNVLLFGLSELRKVETGGHHQFEMTDYHGNTMEMIAIKVPIKTTPFSLITVVPSSEVFGRVAPWHVLMAMGALSVVILGGLGFVWHINVQKMALHARLDESSKRKQDVEEKNRQLEREIVERTRAQEDLKRSEERYALAQRVANIGSWERNLTDNRFSWSEQIEPLIGFEPGEFDGTRGAFLKRVHPDDRHKLLDASRALVEGEKDFAIEHRIIRPNGEIRWIVEIGDLVRDVDGEAAGIIGIIQDISERKQAEEKLKQAYQELKDTQAQLVQSAKLASIGELAAGVAHELNQPLTVIRTTAQAVRRIIKKGHPDVEQLHTYFEPLERNTKRMMTIINHLRTFSRQSQAESSLLDVNTIIEDSFLMIGEQLRLRNIEVKKNLFPNLPNVRGDANQLEQIFLNLLTNARDAIEVKREKNPRNVDIITRVSFDNNGFVEVLVKDSGTGIAADHLERIFDPFFTTKDIGKGTGLGLSISYGIIRDHHGEIEVAETGPGGTTFRVKLPVFIDD